MGDRTENSLEDVVVLGGLKPLAYGLSVIFVVLSLLFLMGGFILYAGLKDQDMDFYIVVLVYSVVVMVETIATFPFIFTDKPMTLYTYGCLLACNCVTVVSGIAAVVCHRDTILNSLKEALNITLTNNHLPNKSLELAQQTMKCCGVSNYTDWVRFSPQKVIPLSCCVDPSSCVTANYNDVYQRGCYNIIIEFFQRNIDFVYGAAAAMAVIPFVGSILTCYLGYYYERTRYLVT